MPSDRDDKCKMRTNGVLTTDVRVRHFQIIEKIEEWPFDQSLFMVVGPTRIESDNVYKSQR